MKLSTTLIIATLSIGLVACSTPAPQETDQQITQTSTFTANEAGEFSGDLYAIGYASQFPVDEPFCEKDCATYQGIYFTVHKTDSDQYVDFAVQNAGNAYVKGDTIMLGCVDENFIISYTNDSDTSGRQEYSLDQATSLAILNATKDNPVTLKLTKEPLHGGTEAPACYSHFTHVELAQ